MGRSRYTITDSNAPHFLTFTVLNWLAIFTRPDTVQIILDALIWRQNHKNIKVYGYVILENHMHCILQAPDLRRQVHDFKAFTAKEILRYLEQNKAQKLLEQLAFLKKSHKTDSNYQLWEEGSHPQLIQNEESYGKNSTISISTRSSEATWKMLLIGAIPVLAIIRGKQG
jgi:REP element-mobilizing transposase RayT